MPIETGMYQNVGALPQPAAQPSLLDMASKAYNVAGQANQLRTQESMREAYAANVDPKTGELNTGRFLSDIGKVNPQAAIQMQTTMAESAKLRAEAQKAQMDAQAAVDDYVHGPLGYLLSSAPADRPKVFQNIMARFKAANVPMGPQSFDFDENGNPIYNEDRVRQLYGIVSNRKAAYEKTLVKTEIGQKQAETAKTVSETYARPDAKQILGSQDPAKLVTYMVPKDRQQKALDEIEAAENTKRMSQSIMDAFDQAVKDTSGLGAATSYAKTPRSVLALHQAMQPTFKDLEGTVRQAAMDNTFKNVTPSGIDTDTDVATRRRALEQYLQSKASAPTARAWGIDLSKYASTSPYQAPSPDRNGGGGFPGVESANASEKPAGPPPGLSFAQFKQWKAKNGK